ncbi:MAG: thioesterase family protein [Gemmatimonadales bacterium]|jgi:acyl-CoA thioester hydrolase
MSDNLLVGHPIVVRIPVQWGEMDAYGHVNNTVFFRYFESARVKYLEECRFLEAYERDRVGAILHSTSCRFRRRLVYPDAALIGVRVKDLTADRFTMVYTLVSDSQRAVAAEGESVVVSYDYTSRQTAPIPDYVREAIEKLESDSGTVSDATQGLESGSGTRSDAR